MSGATLPKPTADRKIACVHCGFPTAVAAREDQSDSAERVFCCNGCRGAYELIHGWGLEAYYDLRDRPADEGPIGESTQTYDDLDHPELLGRSAPVDVGPVDVGPADVGPAGNTTLLRSKLSVTGLHCAACVWLLERAPERIAGWQSSKINYHDRTIEIVFDPAVIKLSQIAVLCGSAWLPSCTSER